MLDEFKKWRQALEKVKTSKNGAKDVTAVMVTATDQLYPSGPYHGSSHGH